MTTRIYQPPKPILFKELVTEIIYPIEGSPRDEYIKETINQLKQQSKKKSKTMKLNQLFVNRQLYFVNICLYSEIKGDTNVKAFVDTGAANSLIHLNIVEKFKIDYEPCKMVICTATGSDTESIKGIAHVKFRMRSTRNRVIETCANFIVTEKLNRLDCILGADFLIDENKISSVAQNSIVWRNKDATHRIRIADETNVNNLQKINRYIQKYDPKNLVK
jgi:hypothetical protein